MKVSETGNNEIVIGIRCLGSGKHTTRNTRGYRKNSNLTFEFKLAAKERLRPNATSGKRNEQRCDRLELFDLSMPFFLSLKHH